MGALKYAWIFKCKTTSRNGARIRTRQKLHALAVTAHGHHYIRIIAPPDRKPAVPIRPLSPILPIRRIPTGPISIPGFLTVPELCARWHFSPRTISRMKNLYPIDLDGTRYYPLIHVLAAEPYF